MDSHQLFSSSPVKEPTAYDYRDERPKTPKTPQRPSTPPTQQRQDQQQQTRPFDAEEAREAALQRELDGVRQINQVIEGVISTLEQSRGKMKTVAQTVGNASALLNTWTRLLSQTEHNQRLLLDPQWQGATDDLRELETEALQRQQEAERRAAEAQQRRDEAKRKAEEEERRRLASTSGSSKSARGYSSTGRSIQGSSRVRGRVGRSVYSTTTRGVSSRGGMTGNNSSTSTSTTTGTSGLVRPSSTSTSTSTSAERGGSKIGRGLPRGTRGSGRGVR
ncbi:hypothetical protein SEPCBS57363_006029 [Sporothrix epigloea]|uniref:DASH complex subunit DUO1 n=1 Tax=Sporothrix epigloea TaxID=1892477 RepID=A0ABP0E3Z9_9PEZI